MTARVDELDRNMDTVFDNLLAINTFITALAQSLDAETALAVAQRMDPHLDELGTMKNPPGAAGTNLVYGLRNMCAQRAGLPIRRLV